MNKSTTHAPTRRGSKSFARPKRVRDYKACHSSYMRRNKSNNIEDVKGEFYISHFDLPKVFSRLWLDAENKNEKLREIQVKRLNRSKEAFEKLIPHPKDLSSSHFNLKEFDDLSINNREALENKIIQDLINQNVQQRNSSNLRNDNNTLGDTSQYPNLQTNKASKTKDFIKV